MTKKKEPKREEPKPKVVKTEKPTEVIVATVGLASPEGMDD